MLSPIELFLTCVSTDPHPTSLIRERRAAERGAVVARSFRFRRREPRPPSPASAVTLPPTAAANT